MSKRKWRQKAENNDTQGTGKGGKIEMLDGMKAICAFLKRSESTVQRMVKEYGLDDQRIIWKHRGKNWVADRELLREWWDHQ